MKVVILAGGQSSRMGGGDKTLLTIAQQPILKHIIQNLSVQCEELLINANGDLNRFSSFGLRVFEDSLTGFQGPLAGILAGMDFLKQDFITLASDCPFYPKDIISKITHLKKTEDLDFVSVRSNQQTHPIIGYWSYTKRNDLAFFLSSGQRKIDKFTHLYNVDYVDFKHEPFDPFFNCNTIEELSEAEKIYSSFIEGKA